MRNLVKISAILILLFSGCSLIGDDRDELALARVGDEYLYMSDITSKIPKGIPARDSLSMAKAIINQWIEKHILIEQAEQNVPEEELDFEKKIEQYRNSLLTYYYETQLIKQKVDTNVSMEEIRAYYAKNKTNFLLEKELIKVNYIVVPRDYARVSEARKIFFGNQNTDEIEAYCKENNLVYFLEPEWQQYEELSMEIPFRLTSVKSIDYSEATRQNEEYFYFIRILGTRGINEIKPIGFVEKQIRNIIRNQRKTDFLKKMRQDIVNKGFEDNTIEIY